LIDYPQELKKSHWDKKKGALPDGSPLETRLKTLQKKHESVDWSPFQPDWAKAALSANAVEEKHAVLDRTWRSKVMPLKLEADGASDAAQKLGKEKGLTKPTLDATRAVVDAVKGYAKAIDEGLAQLEQQRATALAGLKPGDSSEGEGESEEAGALFDPKRLLALLQVCRRQPELRVSFAFLQEGKSDPLFAVSAKMAAKTLFSKAQDAAGIKAGNFGRAWVDDKVLYLEVEKAASGIVKKVRVPLKAAGFKVARVVLAGADGTVLEDDVEADAADAAPAATPTPTTTTTAAPAAPDDAPLRFAALLKKLGPAITAAMGAGGPVAAQIKAAAAEAAASGRAKDFARGLDLLQRIEGLLGGASTPAAAAPAAASAPGAAPNVAFTQLRLAWDQTRKKVQAELRKLETSILALSKEEPDFDQIAAGTKNLYLMLEVLDERLIDKLDAALVAADATARQALHEEAREIVGEYVDFLDSDDLMQDIDGNGFTAVAIQSTLSASLKLIGQRLAA
jgi:hypothetical protein